ncbi:MAG TPA: aquaporin [Gemmataceae bacterium]|nr:aquaporin [Gemmataceae bacterium]
MDTVLRRGFVAELLGTFAVVYFSAGAVCVNLLTTTGSQPGLAPLHALQPGLIGVALAHGLVVAAALAVTVRLSGGYLNPAITLMLWVFNRLDNKRTGLCLLAQLAGAVLAVTCLRFTFDDSVLKYARLGAPHLSLDAFKKIDTASVLAGTGIELILTFFLVFAIFGIGREANDPERAAWPAGLMLIAGTILAGPLTGACANPARWIATVLWEQLALEQTNPWADTFVYLAGPTVGALAAGVVVFRILLPESAPTAAVKSTAAAAPVKQQLSGSGKKK